MNDSQLITVNTDNLSICWNPTFDTIPTTSAAPSSLTAEERVEYEMEEERMYFLNQFDWWVSEGRDVLHALAEKFQFKAPGSNKIWNQQGGVVKLIRDHVEPGCIRLALEKRDPRDPERTRTDMNLSGIIYTILNMAGETIVEKRPGLETMTGKDILKTHGLVGHLYTDDQDVESMTLRALRSTHPSNESAIEFTFVKVYPTLYLWPSRRVSIRGGTGRMQGFRVATLTEHPPERQNNIYISENDEELKLGNLAYNPTTGTLAAEAGPFTLMLEGLTQVDKNAAEIAAQVGRDLAPQKAGGGWPWNRGITPKIAAQIGRDLASQKANREGRPFTRGITHFDFGRPRRSRSRRNRSRRSRSRSRSRGRTP